MGYATEFYAIVEPEAYAMGQTVASEAVRTTPFAGSPGAILSVCSERVLELAPVVEPELTTVGTLEAFHNGANQKLIEELASMIDAELGAAV